jgi:hypothetical protein
MAKKIKRSKVEGVYVDPNLEDVGEERAFEIELDEETEEILFVHHYRQKWGDGFDSDIEHGFSIEEANQIVVAMLDLIEEVQKKRKAEIEMPEKSTPELIEGNPIKENKKV